MIDGFYEPDEETLNVCFAQSKMNHLMDIVADQTPFLCWSGNAFEFDGFKARN